MSKPLEHVVALAREGATRDVHLIFSHLARFCDPLVTRDRERLADFDLPQDAVSVAERVVKECGGPALYFPVPLARALSTGLSWEAAVDRFHYTMILVDADQVWSWRGQAVADRTKAFFLQHGFFEPEIGRWGFEYKVNDNWWDKSYFQAAISPFLASRLEVVDSGAAPTVVAHLASGQRPNVLLDTFRLDRRERLFVNTDTCGEVLLTDTERFNVLKRADASLETVRLAGRDVPLRWPSDGPTAD